MRGVSLLEMLLVVALIAIIGVLTATGQGAIAFYPDGASSGGSIDLQVREAVWHIDVGWITGDVRSGPQRDRP